VNQTDFDLLKRGVRDQNQAVRIAAGRAVAALANASIVDGGPDADPWVRTFLASDEVTAPFWSAGPEVSGAVEFAAPSAGDFLGSLGTRGLDPLVMHLARAISPGFARNLDADPFALLDLIRSPQLGAGLKVGPLFTLYLSLLDENLRSRQAWLRRVDPKRQPDDRVLAHLTPQTEFRALRLSRLIAWLASRGPLERALAPIKSGATAQLPKIRLGAYQFLEDLLALRSHTDLPDLEFAEELAGGSVTKKHPTAVRSVEPPRPAALAPRPDGDLSIAQRQPPPRYADIRFFYDVDGALGEPLISSANLVPDRWYWLEVAIRVNPIGVPAPDRPFAPIRSVRQAGAVRILVVAESKHFDLERSIDWIELPPTGDALEPLPCFKVKVPQSGMRPSETPEIQLRFYYRFNLIEHVVVSAQCAAQDGQTQTPCLTKRQISVSREYLDLDEFIPRRMNVHITRDQHMFRFRFTLSAASTQNQIVLSAESELSSLTLEGHILEARSTLETLALRNYVDPEQETKGRVREAMRSLASVGRGLWRALFKGDPASDLAIIGTALQETPLATDSLVQISMPGLNTGFLYPWALLYDRPLPDEDHLLPDPAGFWGYRYAIEQQLGVTSRRPDAATSLRLPLNMAYMLWEAFPNAADQTRFLRELASRSEGNLTVNDPPLTKASEFYARLKTRKVLDSILYFYTHGIGKRPRTADGVSALAEGMRARLSALPAASTERRDLEQFVERLQGAEGHAESSIEFSSGRLTYLELADANVLFTHGPFVFLNMCESAQLLPLDGENFVALFLRMGARAVLGTECTMTVRFAHPFAQQLLTELLQGTMVAEALRRVRQSFLDARNPLCLAYTLFGSGTLRFQPAPLSAPAPPHERNSP
jgi:hypothetical protein